MKIINLLAKNSIFVKPAWHTCPDDTKDGQDAYLL